MVSLDALFFIYSWHNKVSGKKLIGCKSELFVSAIAVSSGLRDGGQSQVGMKRREKEPEDSGS